MYDILCNCSRLPGRMSECVQFISQVIYRSERVEGVTMVCNIHTDVRFLDYLPAFSHLHRLY